MLLRPLKVVLSHLNLDEKKLNGLTSAVLCITHGEKDAFLKDKSAYLNFFSWVGLKGYI